MPNTPLTLANVLPYLERQDRRPGQLADHRPGAPGHGALISPEFGMPWGQLAGGFITGVAYRFLGALRFG